MNHNPVKYDFRSDTVTVPTEKMRQQMLDAPLGDDVYGEDPTINELQELAAKIVGKEAALFVPSGTFGNQVSVMTLCKPAQEIILPIDCHIFRWENAGIAKLAGCQSLTLFPDEKGFIKPEHVETHIRKDLGAIHNAHTPGTGLITIEPATSSGKAMPLDLLEKIHNIANKYHVPIHYDGARIFNAATTLKTDVKNLTKYCTTVQFCLSKGLCSPVGSLIAGDKEFIDKARKNRKLLGGGLRQAGILAAAGIVSLKDHIHYLEKDHIKAQYLGQQLSKIKGIEVILEDIQINMVYWKIVDDQIDSQKLNQVLKDKGFKMGVGSVGGLNRLVTHYYIENDVIDLLAKTMQEEVTRQLGGSVKKTKV